MTLQEFEDTLTGMSTRSKAFQLVKEEMIRRGHWKKKPRGLKKPLRNLAGADTHSKNSQQVKSKIGYNIYRPYTPQDTDFSEGL